MRKLLFSWLLLFSVDAVSIHRFEQSSQRVTPKQHTQFKNTPPTFGTTHFIHGYKNPRISSGKIKQNKHEELPQTPQTINGSSTHLLDETLLMQSFCTLDHNLSSIVLSILSQAKEAISIAAFNLTDARIANELIAAHKKGVDVFIIMDGGNMKHNYSKAQKLIDNGISVWRYDPSLRPNHKKRTYEQLMHLKWIIADDVLIEGSANHTRSAQDGENIEGILVIRCPQVIKERHKNLQSLKSYCVQCSAETKA